METELESLVVRLLGDGASYKQMLAEAQQSTREATQAIQQQTERIEGFLGGLKSFAGGAISLLSGLGIKAWLQGALDSFSKFESGQMRLTAAIEAGGREAAPLIATYNEFAGALANTTTQTRGSLMALFRQAEIMGVSGDAAQRAVRNAVALGAAHEGEAASFLRATVGIEQGHLRMLRMIPGLRGVRDEGELMTRAQHQIAAGMRVAEAEALTLSGQMTKLKQEMDAVFTKQFGPIVADMFKPIVEIARDAVKWFKDLGTETKTVIVSVAALTFAALAFWGAMVSGAAVFNMMTGGTLLLIGAIVTAGVALGVWINNIGGVKEAWARAKEWGISAWETVKSYLIAFWEFARPYVVNQIIIWRNVWNGFKAVALAVWDGIKAGALWLWDGIKAIWQGIFGEGGEGMVQLRDLWIDGTIAMEYGIRNFRQVAELAWVAVRYGFAVMANEVEHFFRATIPALLSWFKDNWQSGFTRAFRAPPRALGEMERSLRAEMVRMGRGVAEGFQEMREARWREIGEFQFPWEGEQSRRDARQAGEDIGNDFSDGLQRSTERADFVAFNSAEAISRILAYRERMNAAGQAAGRALTGGRNAGAGGAGGGPFDVAPPRVDLPPRVNLPPRPVDLEMRPPRPVEQPRPLEIEMRPPQGSPQMQDRQPIALLLALRDEEAKQTGLLTNIRGLLQRIAARNGLTVINSEIS